MFPGALVEAYRSSILDSQMWMRRSLVVCLLLLWPRTSSGLGGPRVAVRPERPPGFSFAVAVSGARRPVRCAVHTAMKTDNGECGRGHLPTCQVPSEALGSA